MGQEETFDISMTASSTAENGRSYLAEQQRVPYDATPMALATTLRALMGQLHPEGAVVIDSSVMPRVAQPVPPGQVQVPGANVHEQIVDALTIMNAWRERGEKYATLTAEQVHQVTEALDAADTLAHVVHERGGGAVARVRQQARVILGEIDGTPVFREATLAADSDRPDGSLLVTLDPSLSRPELEFIQFDQVALMRRRERDSAQLFKLIKILLRHDEGLWFCRVCNASCLEEQDVPQWMVNHFEQGRCWQPVAELAEVNAYVPIVTTLRPGDEVRIEFAQDDGTFLDDPVGNGAGLDYGYVSGTVIMPEPGMFVLDDDDRTHLQMTQEPESSIHGRRARRVFLIKRGEWSSAVHEVYKARQEREKRHTELRSIVEHYFPEGVDGSVIDLVRLLRQQAENRRIYLSQIAAALGLPQLNRDTPISTEVETVRAILGLIKGQPSSGLVHSLRALMREESPDELVRTVHGVAHHLRLPGFLDNGLNAGEVVRQLGTMVESARNAALADTMLSPQDSVIWRLSTVASALGLHARQDGAAVLVDTKPFPEEAAAGE